VPKPAVMYGGFISQKSWLELFGFMDNKGREKKKNPEALSEEAKGILKQAEIMARWSRKPFYIS
jgi:hypothetical protein